MYNNLNCRKSRRLWKIDEMMKVLKEKYHPWLLYIFKKKVKMRNIQYNKTTENNNKKQPRVYYKPSVTKKSCKECFIRREDV